jgi:hypothetical protein
LGRKKALWRIKQKALRRFDSRAPRAKPASLRRSRFGASFFRVFLSFFLSFSFFLFSVFSLSRWFLTARAHN